MGQLFNDSKVVATHDTLEFYRSTQGLRKLNSFFAHPSKETVYRQEDKVIYMMKMLHH